MSKLYITEFSSVGWTNAAGPAPFPQVPHTTTQVVTFTATAGTSSPLAASTKMVRLHADGICSFAFVTGATVATTNDSRLNISQTEYYMVGATTGLKVSAVTNT